MTPDPVALAARLIACASVTPADDGAQAILTETLAQQGFTVTHLPFGNTRNLFARRGEGGPHLCFAGHTDVVPPGEGWADPPFAARMRDGALFGRGAVDMKGAVAAFVAACGEASSGTVSLLITGDEEGPATDGTMRVVEWLRQTDQLPDFCLVGEPTCQLRLGDTVKIGRRGSLTARLTVRGVQGHVAYPHRADNPVHRLARIVAALAAEKLDQGTAHFAASTLQCSTIDTGNPAANVIPGIARATLNVRYNDAHTAASLKALIGDVIAREAPDHSLEFDHGAECFLTANSPALERLIASVTAVTGVEPALDTGGGTSDARFLAPFCPVAEFGLVGTTMHQVDECVPVADLRLLTKTYLHVIEAFAA